MSNYNKLTSSVPYVFVCVKMILLGPFKVKFPWFMLFIDDIVLVDDTKL